MSAEVIDWLIAAVPAAVWVLLLLLPWRPWSTRECIQADAEAVSASDPGDITVVIPARNEAGVIGATLAGLQEQGDGLQVIVVDDQSDDATAQVVARHPWARVISGQAKPEGWAGKPWALEQGLAHVRTGLTLLLDADVRLQPGLLAALLAHKQHTRRHLVSVMADLRRTSVWDRLLLPAFVYYFKLLYPFALSNGRWRHVAAAAGGCILVETDVLRRVGAFGSLRGALIDDCTLARQVKRAGYRTWIGLSRDVISLRPYGDLRSIHDMVARSAFTQLGESTLALLAVTVVFGIVYGVPLVMLVASPAWPLALLALLAMMLSYIPLLRYYRLSPAWALLLPLAAALYLGMTWSSAIRTWRGVRSRWKGRTYGT